MGAERHHRNLTHETEPSLRGPVVGKAELDCQKPGRLGMCCFVTDHDVGRLFGFYEPHRRPVSPRPEPYRHQVPGTDVAIPISSWTETRDDEPLPIPGRRASRHFHHRAIQPTALSSSMFDHEETRTEEKAESCPVQPNRSLEEGPEDALGSISHHDPDSLGSLGLGFRLGQFDRHLTGSGRVGRHLCPVCYQGHLIVEHLEKPSVDPDRDSIA